MRVKRHFKTTCRRPPSQNVSAQQEGNVFGPLDPNDQIQVSSLKALPSFARLRLQQEDGGRRGGAELEQEDDVLRAKPDPCVAKYRAMSGAQRDQVASAMIMKLKWGKDRLAFIQ